MDIHMDSNSISSITISNRPYPYNSYQTLLEFKNNKITVLELQNEYLELINKSYISEIKYLENKIILLEKLYTVSKKEGEEMQSMLLKYHNTYANILESNEMSNNSNNILQTQNGKLQLQNGKLQSQNGKLQVQNQKMYQNYEELKKDKKQLEDELILLHTNNSIIDTEKSVLLADKTIIETDLVITNTELHQLQEDKSELQKFIKKQDEYIEVKDRLVQEEKNILQSRITKIQEDLEFQKSENLCSICCSEKKNSLVLPCKHCYACQQCLLTCFQENIHVCSICRKPIENIQRIFIQ